ncbi:hypothetical protein ACFHWS_17635 [Micromonospora sp. LOL_013]|uniref:hypothetical protein n=1 Tax=Micromonospora sp. LOL_013 TaxID=3345414 RepID=UPI003A8C7DDF
MTDLSHHGLLDPLRREHQADTAVRDRQSKTAWKLAERALFCDRPATLGARIRRRGAAEAFGAQPPLKIR